MGRLRSRWVLGLLGWTGVMVLAAIVVAVQAIMSLDGAQQACFFQYPQVACPGAGDPAIARLTFAFFGIPLVWIIGLGLAAVVRAARRRRAG